MPGQLTVITTTTGQIRLTGQLHWSGHAQAQVTSGELELLPPG